MTGTRNSWSTWGLASAALLVIGASSSAAAAPATPIATIAVHGSSVSFAPQVSFQELTLTVAGGDYNLTKSFGSGETALFEPVDAQGFQLPDGTYKWQLVTMPRPQDLKVESFRHEEISEDGRSVKAAKATQGLHQSGTFTIKNGVVVDPNLVEVESSRKPAPPTQAVSPSEAARASEQTDRDGE